MIGRMSPRRRRGTVLPAAGILIVASAVMLGWRDTQPIAPRDAAIPAAQWALPSPRHDDAEADAAVLRARRPWGGSTAFHDTEAPAAPPVAATWRLVGTIARDDRRLALVEVGPQPESKLEYRGIGDRLPDSSVVMQIEPDSITTQGGEGLPAGPIVHRLFEKKS
jgi:hypothetical protein